MSKKIINKLLESAGLGGGTPSVDKPNKTEDLKLVVNTIDSVKTWNQLETSKNLIINFIKKHKIQPTSPEYKYVIRLYNLRKKLVKAHRMDENDDDGESLRYVIKQIVKESLNWSDKDENWSTDSNWGKDPNWVQGETPTSGGDGDYDSFMSEDDDFDWIRNLKQIQPRQEGDLREGDTIYVGDKDHPRYIMEILSVDTLDSLINMYSLPLDSDILLGKEKEGIVYRLVYMYNEDNDEEYVGQETIMGYNYAKSLITKRRYWKYLNKVDDGY